MIMVNIYPSVQSKTPSGCLPAADVYQLFKSDEKAKQATLTIQRTFGKAIEQDFPEGKSEYQEAKRSLLQAVCFAGNVDRSAKDQEDFRHSGLLNIDLDEDDAVTLMLFWGEIKSGLLVFAEAAARSVSGKLNGALWINFKIEIPETFSKALLKALKLTGKETRYKQLETLHKAYWKAFSCLLQKEHGIKAGTAGQDLKRARYISHDAETFTNFQAQTYTLEALQAFLERYKEQPEEQLEVFEALQIEHTEDAFLYAERFAAAKGLTFEKGSRHYFRNALAIALNLLGVDQKKAEAFILDKYRPSGYLSNEVSFPYQAYSESFGRWSYRLKPVEVRPDLTFVLKEGQRISDYSEEVAEAIFQHKKIDLEAGTGSGKNFAFCLKIAPLLKAKDGAKMVIVCSLNAKTAKDAEQYSLPFLTGQRLKEAGQAAPEVLKEALKSDVILTNQNYFPKLSKRLKARRQRFHVVIDESHTLTADYKAKVTSELWKEAQTGESLTLLSGTPKPYFQALGFRRLTFIQESRPAINTKVIEYDGKAETLLLDYIQAADLDKKRLVIKLQSKSKIRILERLLLSSGFQAEEVVCLYSDSSVKQSAAYRKFLQAKPGQSSFAEAVKVVLVTSFVNEGLDVYTEDGFRLEFINVEKSSSFSPEDLVQFADRWRSGQEKTLTSFHKKAEDEVKRKDFFPLQQFLTLLDIYQEDAEYQNAKRKKYQDVYSVQALYSTRTTFSNFERFLTFDQEGKLTPDVLTIASHIDELKKRLTSTKEGWKEIQQRWNYFKVTFAGEVEGTASAAHEAAKEAEKLLKKKAEETLKALFDLDKETLLQATGSLTEDVEIKSQTSFKASRREAAAKLTESLPEIFTRRLEVAERLSKAFFKLTKAGFSENAFKKFFFSDKAGEGFASGQALTYFLTALRLHVLLFLFGEVVKTYKNKGRLPVLTVQQIADAKALEAFRLNIETIAGRKKQINSLDALTALRKAYKGRREDLTGRKAVQLLTALFETEVEKTLEGRTYYVKRRLSLEDFLKREQLPAEDVNKYLFSLRNDLNNKDLTRHFVETLY